MKAGDTVRIHELWNETTGNPLRRIAGETKAIRVSEARDYQSGLAVTVMDLGNDEVTLDAGWFTPNLEYPRNDD